MKRIVAYLLIFSLVWPASLRADEGMWLLPLLKKQNAKTMREMGLKLSVDEIYSPSSPSLKDAIVIFGRGCTGEVISNKGLVLTNHHCGYGAIQQHSTVEHDYLKDGFVAQNLEQEIPTPGLTVTFLISQRDVTKEVLDGVSENDNEQARVDKVKQNIEELKKQFTEDTPYNVHVQSIYEGNQYYLFVTETFTDIRMVFAPPSSIGKFGADTDNWSYPRHTGDFSLFRIYANKNNEPADYSEDNVPYKPKRFLSISLSGYKENDFSMILGYPGSTSRYMTSWEVQQQMDHINTPRALIRGVKQEQWMKHMDADPAIRIKYASKYASSSNYWKNAIGQNAALKRLHVVAQKEKEELQFRQWTAQNASREQKYGRALDLIQRGIQAENEHLHQIVFLVESLLYGVELNSMVWNFQGLDRALEDKNEEVIAKYREHVSGEKGDEFFKDYDINTDKSAAVEMMKLYRKEMPKSVWPQFLKTIDSKYKGNVEKYVDYLYDKTMFTSRDKILDFLKKPSLKKLQKDPGYQLNQDFLAVRESMIKFRESVREDLRKGRRLYVAGRLEMLGDAPSYPDANFTMRLTYGSVKSYSPRNSVHYDYYTTLDGVMEKEDPESWEFMVSPKLKDLYKAKAYGEYGQGDGSMWVNFITTNDITGGNSGSPVLDAYGRLIGLAFDGNWESLSGDIAFEHKLQRCINVDIRYVLFVIHHWGQATHLIDELDLHRPTDVTVKS